MRVQTMVPERDEERETEEERRAVNKQVVRAYVDAFNRGDIETLRSLFTPDAIVYGVRGSGGLDVIEPIWRELHRGLAVELTVDEMAAEGDTVAVRYTERGRFVGPFCGQPPTGKSFECIALEWFMLQDGKIHRRWTGRDSATIARQIGLPLA